MQMIFKQMPLRFKPFKVQAAQQISQLIQTKSIQTPQSFKKKIFEKAIFKLKKGYTDDMSALIKHNQNVNVKFFKGDKLNFKITTDMDLHNFKNILKNEK